MNTLLKESLRTALDRLTDEDARQILDLVRRLQARKGVSRTFSRIAGDPVFKMPTAEFTAFSNVQPVPGIGLAASKLLVQDRR